MKTNLLFGIALFLFATIANGQKPLIFQTDKKAIGGFDVVSYFTETGPAKGVDSFSVQWENTTWLFASAANKNAFKENPEKYCPQFGGYCAYGMANAYKAPTEADAWTILDGRLYFNYNKKVSVLWNKDRAGYIEKANKSWPDVKSK